MSATGALRPPGSGLHRITVIDKTLPPSVPKSGNGLVTLLKNLVGVDVTFHCARSEPEKCREDPLGPCPNCVAEDHVENLAEGDSKWSVAKLNQLLILVGQEPVSDDFFRLFFGSAVCDDPGFLLGLAQFRAYAMLVFGSFKSALAKLGRADEGVIRQTLGRWADTPSDRLAYYHGRPHGTPLVGNIADVDRPFLGYLLAGRLKGDLELSAALDKAEENATELTRRQTELLAGLTDPERVAWTGVLGAVEKQLLDLQERVTRAQSQGLANTSGYLAANHIDVYVATSMRADSEYYAVAAFVRDLTKASNELLTKQATGAGLKLGQEGIDLTLFDPTLSYSADRIDKGLVEGLMLRQAECTVYMVQETDTIGKDSELATTLARGRVVVAFVPQEASAAAFAASPELLKKRALSLLADGHYEPKKVSAVYKVLDKLVNQPKVFTLIEPAVAGLVGGGLSPQELTFLVDATVEAERAALTRRASSLQTGHPLALQLELSTGVANGVLVARTVAECARLVERTLLNCHEFEIDVHHDKMARPVATVLSERTTDCPFRVVTWDPVLTNAFWSRYPQ
jgi:hypothetical protein